MPFPLERKFVDETQRRLGIRFPPAFVAKMIRENGGAVEISGEAWWLFPILDSSDTRRLKRPCNDIVRETEKIRAERLGFPPAGVAIGENGAGDLLVLLPDENDLHRLGDAIWSWRLHGGESTVVGASFDDFMVPSGMDDDGFAR